MRFCILKRTNFNSWITAQDIKYSFFLSLSIVNMTKSILTIILKKVISLKNQYSNRKLVTLYLVTPCLLFEYICRSVANNWFWSQGLFFVLWSEHKRSVWWHLQKMINSFTFDIPGVYEKESRCNERCKNNKTD